MYDFVNFYTDNILHIYYSVYKIVNTAFSIVGKVNYFWGGKSSVIEWDDRWGKLMTITSKGSSTTGMKRPFGVDCSGYVT